MPQHPGKTPRRKGVDAHARGRKKAAGQAKVDVAITGERLRAHKREAEGKPLSAAQKLVKSPRATREQQSEATRALQRSRKKRRKGS